MFLVIKSFPVGSLSFFWNSGKSCVVLHNEFIVFISLCNQRSSGKINFNILLEPDAHSVRVEYITPA